MKYINLERPASIWSIVLFAYKPPLGKEIQRKGGGKEKIHLTCLLLSKEPVLTLVAGIY